MSDLSERMRGVDDVPFEQDWEAIRTRLPSGEAGNRPRSPGSRRPGQKPTPRGGVVAVALVASIASLGFLLISFNGPAPSSVGTTHTPNPSTPVIDGWYVSMSYEPTTVGPLGVSFGPIQKAPGRAWVTHRYTITNQSDVTVQLDDSRTSTFLGPHKNILAESGCGYAANGPSKPVHPNACETIVVPQTLKPGHSVTTAITLMTGLPGMGPLTSGTYVFNQPIGFTIPSKKMVAPSRAHVHITYQVADAYGITGGASLSGTYTDPMGIPITFTYPSTWFARSVSASADGLSEGAAISNVEEAVPSTDPGPMPDASPPLDYVRVTIFTANGDTGTTGSESDLPLSMDNAKVAPGGENVRVLNAQVAGVSLVIEVSAGPRASQTDLVAADAIVSSIRPSTQSPPASSPAATALPNSGQLNQGAFGDPCDRFGQPTDLATASKVGYTLFAPHDSLADPASPASLTGVRTCPGGEVEMKFSSGVTVIQEVNGISDPGKAWQRLASADPTSTSVGAVQGQPAALIQPGQGAMGSVTVVLDGTIVWVVGDGQISITDLQRVAQSLQPA